MFTKVAVISSFLFLSFGIGSGANVDIKWVFGVKPLPPMADHVSTRCSHECVGQQQSCCHKCQGTAPCPCSWNDIKKKQYDQVAQGFIDCIKGDPWWTTDLKARKTLFDSTCGVASESWKPHKIPGMGGKFKFQGAVEDSDILGVPWAIRITKNTPDGVLVGTGTLVSDTKVLTTGKIIHDADTSNLKFSGGKPAWQANVDDGRTASFSSIERNEAYDLALITIDKYIPNTAPVCIAPQGYRPRTDVQYAVYSWGKTSEKSQTARVQISALKEWRDGMCNKEGSKFFCSQKLHDGKNVCLGDKGAGMVHWTTNNAKHLPHQFYLIGIMDAMFGNAVNHHCGKSENVKGRWVDIEKARSWLCAKISCQM